MAREGAKNRKMLAMQQETQMHLMKSVVQQMPSAYVTTSIGILCLFLKLFQGWQCAHSCNWRSRHQRSQAKFIGPFPFRILRRLPSPSRYPKENRCKGAVHWMCWCTAQPLWKHWWCTYLPAIFIDTISKWAYEEHEIQDARTWLPQLGALANSRLKILIWVRAYITTTCIRDKIWPLFLTGRWRRHQVSRLFIKLWCVCSFRWPKNQIVVIG